MLKPASIRFSCYLFLVILFFTTGCTKKETADQVVVATWDNASLTAGDFREIMTGRYGNEAGARRQDLTTRRKVLNDHIEHQIKLAEARKRGIDQGDVVMECCDHKIHTLQMKVDDAVDHKVAELTFADQVQKRFFTEKMIRDYWEHDKKEIRARHILISVPEAVTGDDTLEYWKKAEKVWREAGSGENFEKLVDNYSDDDSIERSRHGDLGFFPWGKMVDEFQDAAWDLKVGEISAPVRTIFGYHIIKMLESRPHHVLLNVSQILTKCKMKSDPAETTAAYERTLDILKEAKKSSADFSQLARAYSEDERSWVNGELGFIPQNGMPAEFWETALSLKDGEIGGPVRTRYGYHIIKRHAYMLDVKSLDDYEVRKQILISLTDLFRDSLQVISNAYRDSIQQAFHTTYNEANIRTVLSRLNRHPGVIDREWTKLFTPEQYKMVVCTDQNGDIHLEDLLLKSEIYPANSERAEISQIMQLIEPIQWTRLLCKIGRELNFYNNPDVLKAEQDTRENMMLLELRTQTMIQKTSVKEEEVRKRFEEKRKLYVNPGLDQTLEDVRHKVEMDVRRAQWNDMQKDWVAELWKSHNVVVNADALKGVWDLVEPLPDPIVKERRQSVRKRRAAGSLARTRRTEDSQIQMKLKPGSTQTFQRDGKDIQVKIGEPVYKKNDKVIDPTESDSRLTPEGRIEPNVKKVPESQERK